MFVWVPVLMAGLFLPGLAQRTTDTGTLNGTVSDDEGLPLPGVTVAASSPSLMLPQISTATDERGFFRLPQLPTGEYKVVFTLDGFATLVREKIVVSLGSTSVLNVTLRASVLSETIIVVGQGPIVDIESTSIKVNIDRDLLQNIPSGRAYTSVLQMAPGVYSDGGRPASHGSTVYDNDFNLDGVSISSPRSGMYSTVQVSYDIAEEFQVQSGGHNAEYGAVRGSFVNLISKSGSNDFHGEANFYFQDKSLQSDNTKGTPLEGTYVGFNYAYDASLQLGGPIFKDRLWFFANFSQTYDEVFVEGYPYDKDTQVPDDYRRRFPGLKFSWQINPSMKIVAGWNGWWALRNNRSASRFRTEESTWKGVFKSQTFNISYSYIISNNMIFAARAAAALADTDYYRKNDLPSYYETTTRLFSGGMGYDNLQLNNGFQFLSDFTYFIDDLIGHHEFKTGVELSWRHIGTEEIYSKDPRNGIGYYFETRNGLPYRAREYIRGKEILDAYAHGFFVQDKWKPVNRLVLNLGARFDFQKGVVPKQGENRTPVVYGGVTYDPRVLEPITALSWKTVSPRLGVSYDLTGDAKTALKINFGRYYLHAKTTYFNRLNPNGRMIAYYNLNPDWSLGTMYAFSAATAGLIDPNLKPAYLDEFILGIERELFSELSLKISYIRKWDRQLIDDVVLEALDLNAIKDGQYQWSGYNPVTVMDPYNNHQIVFYNRDPSLVAESAFLTNPGPEAKRNYSGMEVVLKKRLSKNWQMLASYVYAKATGLLGGDENEIHGATSYFNNPNAHTNAYGRLPGERRHQIKFMGTYQAPWQILISTNYGGFSGAPYTRTVRSNDLGLNLRQGNVSIYAEKRGSRFLPWLHQWDLRAEKRFKIKSINLAVIMDAFNIVNLNTKTSVETISSSSLIAFEQTTTIMSPRAGRIALRATW